MKNQKTSAHGGSSVFRRGMRIKRMGVDRTPKPKFPMMSSEVTIGRFGALFPNLPVYNPSDDAIKQTAEIMKENSQTSNDSTIPLAFAFFGQFVDHDLTLEPVSRFDQMLDPMALVNFRTPALDLDSVYGSNPDVSRHLYDTYGETKIPAKEHRLPFRLLTELENISIDLQRNRQGTAIIGDPRNDENLFISQLHRMIIRFHNEVIKQYLFDHRANTGDANWQPIDHKELYEKARRAVTLHYHWIIKNEFLPHIIGDSLTNDILQNGRKFYKYEDNGDRPFIPVEFGGAAYRFGHTLIREHYNINSRKLNMELFKVPFFGVCPLGDCDGRQGVSKNYNIDWRYFADFGDNTETLQFCRKIDASIAKPLFDLPFIDKRMDPPVSLPERNMRRARTLMLPSGQAVARAMDVEPINNNDLGVAHIQGLNDEAPLWYYILKEGELQTEGKHLGQVGGRIVGEVLLGIIEATQKQLHYFENTQDMANWKPDFGNNGQFTLKNMLTFSAERNSLAVNPPPIKIKNKGK